MLNKVYLLKKHSITKFLNLLMLSLKDFDIYRFLKVYWETKNNISLVFIFQARNLRLIKVIINFFGNCLFVFYQKQNCCRNIRNNKQFYTVPKNN